MSNWREFFLGHVIPKPSSISTGKSKIVENSKPCTSRAIVRFATFRANPVPGQDLLPEPKGVYSNCCPKTSTSACFSKNLSGLNSSGCDQIRGSLCSFHRLANNRVPFWTLYPPTMQSSIASCGTERGAGGYNLNVSLNIASR